MAAESPGVAEYRSSVRNLVVNSKHLITILTRLADERKDHANEVIGIIEEQIIKAPSNQKLPVIYLINSIVKKVGEYYKKGFSNNLVKVFAHIFERVEEKTRKKLYELRQTWNGIIPESKHYDLDKHVHQLDPAWPITSSGKNKTQYQC